MPSFTFSAQNVAPVVGFLTKTKADHINIEPGEDGHARVIAKGLHGEVYMVLTVPALHMPDAVPGIINDKPVAGLRVDRREFKRCMSLAKRIKCGTDIDDLRVVVGGSRVVFNGAHAPDIAVDLPAPCGKEIAVDSVAFADALAGVMPALSKDEARVNLWSIRWTGADLVSTDGHRLHRVALQTHGLPLGDMGKATTLIPRDAAEVLAWALSGALRVKTSCPTCGAKNRALIHDTITGQYDSASWSVKIGAIEILAKHSAITFPPVEHVIPKERKPLFTMDRDVVLDAIPLLIAGGDTTTHTIQIKSAETRMSEATDVGDVTTAKTLANVYARAQRDSKFEHDTALRIANDYALTKDERGDEIRFEPFGMNAAFLRDALAMMPPGSTVSLSCTGSLDPIVIEGGDALAVVMPMRI